MATYLFIMISTPFRNLYSSSFSLYRASRPQLVPSVGKLYFGPLRSFSLPSPQKRVPPVATFLKHGLSSPELLCLFRTHRSLQFGVWPVAPLRPTVSLPTKHRRASLMSLPFGITAKLLFLRGRAKKATFVPRLFDRLSAVQGAALAPADLLLPSRTPSPLPLPAAADDRVFPAWPLPPWQ